MTASDDTVIDTAIDIERAKRLARTLRRDLAEAGVDISHSFALELVAHQHGVKDWNVLVARAGTAVSGAAPKRGRVGPGVPVLRVMSVEVALPFYVGYLGFTVDWAHRFEPGLPVYAQVSRSAALLHLSEHHGDGSPHGVVWLPVSDVYALRDELLGRAAAPLRPGVDPDAPGGPTLEVIDPYGNVLRFAQPAR
ncbi:glyoxalase [Sphaerisporangium rufum]|uniref:Bleomycin resistance protein n=1 Tax=Sphaerisporangium rufum TaxID=1381558 RepID=A0A919R0R2_9ACTN|nr:glyoxalase superfamily protein [Sphaerisporangium rufum]GII76285.1 glyoxalase [Sphaerisporangium rufum]